MRSYPVKEKHICSVVSERLWYKQTNILLLYYKDFLPEWSVVNSGSGQEGQEVQLWRVQALSYSAGLYARSLVLIGPAGILLSAKVKYLGWQPRTF